MWGICCKILSVPHNIDMDLNNVMKEPTPNASTPRKTRPQRGEAGPLGRETLSHKEKPRSDPTEDNLPDPPCQGPPLPH